MARGLVAKRHTRLFYVTSAYPSQSIKRMLGLEHAQATRKQFLVEMTLHEYIIAYLVQSEYLMALLFRSPTPTTPC
jgi:hypothetical protein